jgi:tRNA modification GTPase
VVRVSGRGVREIAAAILGAVPEPRHAGLARFRAADGATLDQGIALFFPGPHSYTGEDVLELQGHGGPVVMHELLRRCMELGARVAQPGEFTRRAFLNDRIDLAQAESVADLIEASSAEAARSAARSLEGEFSRRIGALVEGLIDLRMHVEACIDFPEEEIAPAERHEQDAKRAALLDGFDAVIAAARQGAVLREGLTVVLVGRPNVGKSSLLNRLAGDEVAIVTPIAGTTRDYVRATISIEGVPIHLIDTAGLRESRDEVERIGVERTWLAIARAGAALFIEEASGEGGEEEAALRDRLPAGLPTARVVNKIDLAGGQPGRTEEDGTVRLRVSAKSGEGVPHLRQWLLETAGWQPHGEGLFMARGRHIEALQAARAHLDRGGKTPQAPELMAEDLRLAQVELGRITGEVSADELLGVIFSRFCVGK